MLTCRMHTVEQPGGRVEWRVAPESEPLASCAFPWPAGWSPAAPPWIPPPLHGRAPLCALRGPEAADALDVSVMRFGVEVDGLAALRATTDAALADVRWTGLPLVEATADGARWAVVHAGPALFALRATGAAAAHLPVAARGLRSLTDWSPVAEPLAPLRIGPLSTRRFAAWTVDPPLATPHGHARGALRLADPTHVTLARIEALVVDCTVFPGIDPRGVIAAADKRLELLGVEPGEGAPDPGPSGPARTRRAKWVGAGAPVEVEHRRAIRRIGRALAVIDGLWRTDAPVARLNGRRHLDVLLARAGTP